MIPKTIKEIYKDVFVLTTCMFVLGIFLNKVELYFAFVIGSIVSMINMYLLIIGAYKVVFLKINAKSRGFFEYLKRYFVYFIGLLIVAYTSKIFFKNHIKTNIIATGIAFLNFKIILFFREIAKKFAKIK